MPEEVKELKHLVRIANTDLDGRKHVVYALEKIKGVGINFAHAICKVTKINPATKIGALSDEDIKKLIEATLKPAELGLPVWFLNRRKDLETGKNMHLLTSELQFTIENDIKLMKKIKSYKGIRHMMGQPVRGQRTRSHFRRNKGKVNLGVRRAPGVKKGGGKT